MPRKPQQLKATVTVDPFIGEGGIHLYLLKIQTDAYEINMRVKPDDVVKFDSVRSAPWAKGSVRIGESAGSHVFWCVGDEGDNSVSVLIGDDDEGWDVAVSLPPGIIDVIRREIAGCHL